MSPATCSLNPGQVVHAQHPASLPEQTVAPNKRRPDLTEASDRPPGDIVQHSVGS